MKIVVDNKIPYIHEEIKKIADDVVYLPAQEFTAESIKDADVLIIRTRVKCNRELLEGSKVQFIATATIGFDHIDTAYCAQHGIAWSNAPGCNANSVQQYIASTLILLKQHYWTCFKGLTLAVVGVGHVGSKVVDLAKDLGLRVLMNDPIRALHEEDFEHTDLSLIQEQADIITFHVPLSEQGEYPTYHLVDEDFLNQLKRKPILINTSRGSVIDNKALLVALQEEKIHQAVLDVWENEPEINLSLLEAVFLGTPHIAGYSADGKAKASEMALKAVVDYFGLAVQIHIEPPTPISSIITAHSQEQALLQIYDPSIDSKALKANPAKFEWFRGSYPIRRESKAFTIQINN